MARVPWFKLSSVLLGSVLLLFIAAPLARLILATGTADLGKALVDPEVMASIWLTLRAAAMATVLSSLFGIPLAYFLARNEFVGKPIVQGVVDLPIMVPHSAAGIALLMLIGRQSFIQKLFAPLGLEFVGEEAGIAVAMAFVSVPFLVNAARDAFAAVPERLEKAARSLGASPIRVFTTISLPLAWRGILTGLVMMWGRGISEFGAVIIIAYHPMTTPVLIFQRFNDFGLSYARSAAALLIIICVTAFILLRLLARKPAREAS